MMIIETKRLRIREYTPEDFNGLYDIISDADTMKYYPKPYDKEGTQRWIDWCINSYRDNGFGHLSLRIQESLSVIAESLCRI